MRKIIVDPSAKITYSSFYLKGLEEIFGGENVSFSSRYFRDLNRTAEAHAYDQYLAFVLTDGTDARKVVIDFRDKPSVKECAYHWCDVYAKVNFNRQLTERRFHGKIVSIPPGFGMNVWGFWKTLFLSVANLWRCNFSPLVPLQAHFKDYLFPCLRRSPLEDYSAGNAPAHGGAGRAPLKPKVFFIATLWEHKNCLEGTNVSRRKFIELCKSSQFLEFEGGFWAKPSHPHYEEVKSLVFSTPYSHADYIRKSRSSAFVFNTPAVHHCHGWKLGEYLAMGKAIISTPLSNDLPEALTHGENIHFVTNEAELGEAIRLFATDAAYRRRLEDGARSYYAKYAEPKRVIQSILNRG